MSSLEVYEIFKNYFGEDRVDYANRGAIYYRYDENQGYYSILVKWDEVVIRNEYNNSTIIKDLYVAIPIDSTGHCHGIYLNKATYTDFEYNAHYIHSHVPRLDYSQPYIFNKCCLGSGPIKRTKNLLQYNPTEDRWMLFCIELDKYVGVESITGGPYIRMSEIKSYTEKYSIEKTVSFNNILNPSPIISDLIKYVIKKDILKYGYFEGKYDLAESTKSLVLKLTDCYIQYAKENNIIDYEKNMIEVQIGEFDLFTKSSSRRPSSIPSSPTFLFNFKEKPVYLNVVQSYIENVRLVINPKVVALIAAIITDLINTKYGK